MLWLSVIFVLLHTQCARAALNYAQCSEKYGNRTYIAEANMFEKYPPHLLSFPGSGNAWVRLLIEYATGFYTGSMDTYDYEFLGDGGFIGEKSCGLRLAALRAHPHFFDFLNGKLRFSHNFQRDKCKRGLIREMKRMIVLVRNPYDSLWSYYQLLNSLNHAGYLTTETFDAANWLYMSPIIAGFWDSQFHRIVKPIFETFPAADLHIVKYEDLMNTTIRATALQDLMSFMQYTVDPEKIECAFLLADKPLVHRNPHDPKRVLAKTAFLLGNTEGRHSVSQHDGHNASARSSAMTHHRNVLCELRDQFSGFARYFNYTLAPVSIDPSAHPLLCELAPNKVLRESEVHI